MVRALLSNHKTQTRRAIKPANVGSAMRDGSDSKCCPFKVGMQLWVKESWHALAAFDASLPREVEVGSPIFYAADGDLPTQAGKSRVALFVPRWASRLTLQVTAVRAEPLRQITEADAIAEGVLAAEAKQHGG